MKSWKAYPRKTDKLILVGLNARTRARAPFDGPDEIWTLNEAYNEKWLQRYDRLFQIHPRQDWQRRNNLADPNHPLYIMGQAAPCIFCDGTGQARRGGEDIACPYCAAGCYTPPPARAQALIYMQPPCNDIPGAIALPFAEMARRYPGPDGRPYFTSTLAYMLVLAAGLMKYQEIELYGFEAESGTEYANQRPCIEYWIGHFRGRGVKISAPGSGLATGEVYAFGDTLQGLRTRLELRRRNLEGQLATAEAEALKAEGAVMALAPFKAIPELTRAYDISFDEHFKRKGFVSFLNGTLKETDNAIRALDAYRAGGDELPGSARAVIELPYTLG